MQSQVSLLKNDLIKGIMFYIQSEVRDINDQKQDIEFWDSEEEIVPQKKFELFDLQGNTVNCNDAKNSLPENSELIQKAMDGDKKAFSELYMQSYRYVFFVVRQYVADDDSVYDVMQETFIKVYKNISRLNSPQAYYSWITAIAKNTARDFVRISLAQSYVPFEEDYSDFLKDDETQKDVSLDIEAVLKKMSPEESDLLSLVYYDGMRISQIAKMQGVPATTVYSRFNKAKKNLKAQLNAHGIDKTIYSGNFMAMLTVSMRNIIGTSLLSIAVAQQILDSIVNGKGKKELAVAKIIRAQQKKMILKIASAIVAISMVTSAVTAATVIDWSRFISMPQGNNTSTVTEYYYQNNQSGGSGAVGFINNTEDTVGFDSSFQASNSSSMTSSGGASSYTGGSLYIPMGDTADDGDQVINTYGNNPNNLMRTTEGTVASSGKVAKQGDWLYYVQNSTRLVRVKTDGSCRQELYETSIYTGVSSLNVVGDTIYYTSGGIWSMNTGGTNRRQISSHPAYNLLVRGNMGWFIEISNTSDTPAIYVDYKLYQIDLVTGEVTTVVENGDGFGLKTVIGDSLIYVNGNSLCSYDIYSGTQSVIKKFDFNAGINNMCVDGSSIYLCGNGLDKRVIKFDLNTLEIKQTINGFSHIYNYFNFGGGAFFAKKTHPEPTFYTLQCNEYCQGNPDIAYELGIYAFDDGYAYYFDDTSTMLSCCTPDGSQYKSY